LPEEVGMLDALRKFVEAGREALTPEKAEELARALVREGQARRDQAARLARDLTTWSRRSSERFMAAIRTEVKDQISRAGLATKDEVEALKRRIRKLESSRAPARKATTARAPARKATRAKPRKKGTSAKA
jgi:polyhydroxyalkanoate synthesis regulator phasin